MSAQPRAGGAHAKHSTLVDADVVRAAIDAGQPRLVFQPIVDLRDRRVIGLEVLARFDIEPHLAPDVWFYSAHRVGLGPELEVQVLRKAATAAASIPSDAFLAVNVSPETVLARDVGSHFDDATAPRIVLEITEHAPVDDYEGLTTAVARLRERGIRIAVDDVGAGYSTLRHVLRLDPEVIKLDGEVTMGVDQDLGRAKFVGGLIAGASAVSALVVAEGIETESQLARLLDLGVRGGQGFLLGRPTELQLAIADGNKTATALAPMETTLRAASRKTRSALTRARILVVDDSVAHRVLIRTTFELEGATVGEATTAAAALHAVETAT
ncbi:MAG: EAL domain-containing protein, partial [Acidimicrobiales bacterium]